MRWNTAYAAAKFGASSHQTYHWDNVGFDGPILPGPAQYSIPDSLKSSSANVGAMALSRQCAELELAGRSGNLDAARELHPKLAAEHERVQAALNEELNLLIKS